MKASNVDPNVVIVAIVAVVAISFAGMAMGGLNRQPENRGEQDQAPGKGRSTVG